MQITSNEHHINKRLKDYILGIIWHMLKVHCRGTFYVRHLRHSALKSSFICLLWSLKSWNICPYYFRFAGRICPPNSDGDEELLAFGIFTKSLFLHLLEQFELGHIICRVLVYFWALERQDKMRLGAWEAQLVSWLKPVLYLAARWQPNKNSYYNFSNQPKYINF